MRFHLWAACALTVLAGCNQEAANTSAEPVTEQNARQGDDKPKPGPPAKSTMVVRVSPSDKATNVNPRAPVQIHFSNGLKLATITADSVRLLDSAGTPIPSRLGSDLEGDVVNLQPTKPLLPRTSYAIEV